MADDDGRDLWKRRGGHGLVVRVGFNSRGGEKGWRGGGDGGEVGSRGGRPTSLGNRSEES